MLQVEDEKAALGNKWEILKWPGQRVVGRGFPRDFPRQRLIRHPLSQPQPPAGLLPFLVARPGRPSLGGRGVVCRLRSWAGVVAVSGWEPGPAATSGPIGGGGRGVHNAGGHRTALGAGH